MCAVRAACAMLGPMAKTPQDETFTTREIAEGVAHDLVAQAEDAVQAARALPPTDPQRLALMNAAAQALAAAAPFVDGRPRRTKAARLAA
jgi:hypothetical protein